jgi:hypothetical protein
MGLAFKKKNQSRHGIRTTTVNVSRRDDGAEKTVKNKRHFVGEGKTFDNAEELSTTNSGLGVTISHQFQSVRIDAWTELPCAANEKAISKSFQEGFELSRDAIVSEMEWAKNLLSGGIASIFDS